MTRATVEEFSPTDAMLARLESEIDEKRILQETLIETAQKQERDLKPEEQELYERASDRMKVLEGQLKPLREGLRIAVDSQRRTNELREQYAVARDPQRAAKTVEYRSAGAYILDYWRAGLGVAECKERLELFNRAAAHQTTTDNPGLLPEQILGPIVSNVDAGRTLVNLLGPRQLPSGSWSRPKVTQNTQIGVQASEKTELISRKMTIAKVPVTAVTYGGYVNVSRQDIDWSSPAIMDLIVNDLAEQYAIETENAAIDALVAGATVGPTLATGALTAAAVAAAFWTAAASVFSATKGQGQIVAVTGPDMLGQYGPLFAPVNPQNSQSAGFNAGDFSTGLAGTIAGIPIYVTPGAALLTTVVMSTAAMEIYEDRIGALQVVEPSVLGVQVAYAGYFASVMMTATGAQKIVKTP